MIALLIILGVFVSCGLLGFLGMRIAAQREEPTLGAGAVEQDLRGGISPSALGGLLGTIPFLIFITVLIIMSMDAHAERLAREAREAAERGETAAPAAE